MATVNEEMGSKLRTGLTEAGLFWIMYVLASGERCMELPVMRFQAKMNYWVALL